MHSEKQPQKFSAGCSKAAKCGQNNRLSGCTGIIRWHSVWHSRLHDS